MLELRAIVLNCRKLLGPLVSARLVKMEQALTGEAKHELKVDAQLWVIQSFPEAYNSHRFSADMIGLFLRRLKWNIQKDNGRLAV